MKCCNICPYESSCTINPNDCQKKFAVFDLAKLPEHDAKVKAEAINEFIKFCDDHFPMDIMSTYEAIDEMKRCYEQLKEQKNDKTELDS